MKFSVCGQIALSNLMFNLFYVLSSCTFMDSIIMSSQMLTTTKLSVNFFAMR